ncbi:hypothetical protein QUC31_005832 [Theobroma cacao]
MCRGSTFGKLLSLSSTVQLHSKYVCVERSGPLGRSLLDGPVFGGPRPKLMFLNGLKRWWC